MPGHDVPPSPVPAPLARPHHNLPDLDKELAQVGSFDQLVKDPQLLASLQASGYDAPSPIQWKAIPLGRLGLDVIAQAKSGTGKTIVFSVLAIEAVSRCRHLDSPAERPTGLQVLILAPTREVAMQIYQVVYQLIQGMGPPWKDKGVCQAFIGGMPLREDLAKAPTTRIAVGTPGRINQLLVLGAFVTMDFQMVVLDEADKLMEGSFQATIRDIVGLVAPLSSSSSPASRRQVLAFSATYDTELLETLRTLTHEPQYIMQTATDPAPTLSNVRQFYYPVVLSATDPTDEGQATAAQHRATIQQQKTVATLHLFQQLSFYQCMVFLNHSQRGQQLVAELTQRGYPAVWISAHLTQPERLAIMTQVRNFAVRVVVCSDLLARGIDIDRVDLVILWDMPRDPETYFHRVGRTGRFGARGTAVTLIGDQDEQEALAILRSQLQAPVYPIDTLLSPKKSVAVTTPSTPTTGEKWPRIALRPDEQAAYDKLLEQSKVTPAPTDPIAYPSVEQVSPPVIVKKRKLSNVASTSSERLSRRRMHHSVPVNASALPAGKPMDAGNQLQKPSADASLLRTPRVEVKEFDTCHVSLHPDQQPWSLPFPFNHASANSQAWELSGSNAHHPPPEKDPATSAYPYGHLASLLFPG
ncbi:hypothetical protein H4R34_002786 [Dimargaris verticillata]|uniref:RNA helicase n=1 Tax=Dimargaris verticillata TaxID=2761393 RepID=A0A9W8ECL3_9FUNG|nr:hypothetical protein H4R34_002786 [Dimargaris verticillata]